MHQLLNIRIVVIEMRRHPDAQLARINTDIGLLQGHHQLGLTITQLQNYRATAHLRRVGRDHGIAQCRNNLID